MIINTKRRYSINERFPEELHVKILNLVRQIGSTGSLTKCMRCCRRWHSIGLQLLYEDIVLNKRETLRKFCRDRYLVNRKINNLLRNLTLSLHALPAGGKDLQVLVAAIRRLSKLHTLSVVLIDESPYIPKLLRVLPQSVQNLEINIKMESLSTSFHFCDEIRKCLSHVKRLRLRLDHVCDNLFADLDGWQQGRTDPVRLKSITITSWQQQHLRWCGSHGEDAFPLFSLYARSCWLSGMFPDCEDFTICGVKHPRNCYNSGLNLLLYRYDVLRDWQSIFPIVNTFKLSNKYRRHIIMKIAPKQLLYGSDHALLTYIENSNGFCETSLGLRIPAPLMDRRDYFQKVYEVQHVQDLPEFRRKSNIYHEDMHHLKITDVVHEKPRFRNFERYHPDFWGLAEYFISTYAKHEVGCCYS